MSLPNLERGGWEPGMSWAADSIEQQKELETRYKAEQIADKAHGYMELFNARFDEEVVGQEYSWDREKEVQKCLALIQAQESYANRSLAEVLSDTLSWVDVIKGEKDRDSLEHTLAREAASLLSRAAEPEAGEEVDSELLGMYVQWSAIVYFTYNYWRDWDRGITHESCLETIQNAGLSVEDLDELLQKPIDAEAERLHSEDPEMYIHGVNQTVLEKRMIKRAKALGFEFGQVHGYGNYLQAWGI